MIKVIHVLSDNHISGAGRHLLNYLHHYDKNTFSVTVMLPKESQLIPYIKKHKDVNLILWSHTAENPHKRRDVKFFKKIFAEISPDIVHTHSHSPARIAARKSKKGKVVSTKHRLETVRPGFKSRAFGILDTTLTDTYIAIADAVKENLLSLGVPEEKIKTIYNGATPISEISDDRKKEIKKVYNISDDETVFGIFTKLEPIKGHKYFLKAARAILRSGYKAKFFIVGCGSETENLKARARSYLIEDNVIFTGFLDDISEILNVVDINVIASESETMSISILEAMSLGKPTIATDVGGNTQLVIPRQTGLLTGTSDSISLADSMIKLMSDKELYKKCSLGAKEKYTKNYTAQQMTEYIEKLYKEIYDSLK